MTGKHLIIAMGRVDPDDERPRKKCIVCKRMRLNTIHGFKRKKKTSDELTATCRTCLNRKKAQLKIPVKNRVVRAHTKTINGKLTYVDAHKRERKDKGE